MYLRQTHKLFCFRRRVKSGSLFEDSQPLEADFLSRHLCSKLFEIGHCESSKLQEYDPGQFFLHRIFGYRGVVLFPWVAKLHDYDFIRQRKRQSKNKNSGVEALDFLKSAPTVQSDNIIKPIYQVLIDQRDYPFVRVYKDDIVLFRKDRQTGKTYLFTLIGFSHASHDDLLPYSSTENMPFKHDSFESCFTAILGEAWSLTPLTSLRSWRRRFIPFLEHSSIYRQTTHNVRVTAIPYYLGHYFNTAYKDEIYLWRFSIRLENFGKDSVTLRRMKCEIVDIYNRFEAFEATGVIGLQPRLSLTKRAFQYSSLVQLRAPRGYMSGKYVMQRDDGTIFCCKIPHFALESKSNDDDDMFA